LTGPQPVLLQYRRREGRWEEESTSKARRSTGGGEAAAEPARRRKRMGDGGADAEEENGVEEAAIGGAIGRTGIGDCPSKVGLGGDIFTGRNDARPTQKRTQQLTS
jgi:hypothetical protein